MTFGLRVRRGGRWLVVVLGISAMVGRLTAADCDQDGVDDLEAIAAGAQLDCNTNGVPDVCEFVPVPFAALTDSLTLDTLPVAVVACDVTGDGMDDLVIASKREFDSPSLLSVFPSLGDREFDAVREFDPGEDLNGLLALDLDGDGDLDLATTDDVGIARTMKNDGEGFFSTPSEISLPFLGSALAASDLDGDGSQDIVTVHPSDESISWLLNRSDGEFLAPVTREVGRRPLGTASEDFDQDGQRDIAVLLAGANRVDVLFAPLAAETTTLELPAGKTIPRVANVAAADFDGDGLSDIVTGGFKGLRVWTNDGIGGFGEPFHQKGFFGKVHIADIDGDAALDLVVGSTTREDFHIFRNQGGRFLPQQAFSFNFVDFALGDLDGDGRLDLGVPATDPSQVTVLWNGEAALELIERREESFDRPHFVDTADINGDGHVDIITSNAGDRTYSLLFGKGDGTFERAQLRSSQRGGLVAVVAEDFDRDGTVDVVFRSGPLLLFLPNLDGTGELPTWIDVPTHGHGRFLLVEDLDGDGHPDLAAPDFEGNVLSVHYTDGTQSLGTRQDLSVGQYPWEVASGDLDGDGILDLVTANGNSSDMSILLQREGRVFEPPLTIPIDGNPHGVVIFDADRDGDMDLVTANDLGEDVAVFLNDGTASFATPLRFPLGRRPYSILATELDGDDLIDLVTTNERSASVSVLRGRGGGGFSSPQQFQVGGGPRLTAGGDFDEDGDVDLVVASRSGTQISILINNSPTNEPTTEFVTSICTALDFSTISVEGTGTSVRRVAHYLLAATDAPRQPAAAFPNAARFGDPRRFLLESFPEEFPRLEAAQYEALVGRRKTREYFTGSIRSIETDAGLVYGVDIATADGEGEELLDAAETAAVLALFAEAFQLEPRVYAPQTPAAKERAKAWPAPGFSVLILEGEVTPEPPQAFPTFQLVIPETTLCGVFGVAGRGRGPADELALKSTVRFRSGTISLPTTTERFASELIEEFTFGPEAVSAVPENAGEFRVGSILGADGVTTFRFTYSQVFKLADGRVVELGVVAPILFRARGDTPLDESLGLPARFFTALKGQEALQVSRDGIPLIRYGSCDYTDLPEWEVNFRLEDQTQWVLRERFEETESEFDTAPAAIVRAQLIEGDRTEVITDYFQLIYSALRHNTEVTYWVLLDPARALGEDPALVSVVELLAPQGPSRPQPQAVYRGVDLEVLRAVEVLVFSREPVGETVFRRGDVDASGGVGLADALALLSYLFDARGAEQGPPVCAEAADSNDDGRLNVLDPVVILGHLLRRGVLPPPQIDCGLDPTLDELDCEVFPPCE